MKQRISINSDTFIGLGLAFGGIVLLILEYRTKVKKDFFGALDEKIFSEKLFPTLTLGFLIIMGTALALISIRAEGRDREKISVYIERTRSVWLVILLSIVYCFLLYLLGYLLSTVVILAALLRVFGLKKPLHIILPSVLIPLGLYLVFGKVLLLMLPKGVIF
jgi:hypothetical protein